MKFITKKTILGTLIILFLTVGVITIISLLYNKPIDIKPNQKIKSNIIYNSLGGWVKITKKYGGPDGFRNAYAQESTTYCIIRYEYPGYEKTDKLNRHHSSKLLYPYDNLVKAIHYAYRQISLGKLEGQQIMPHTFIRVRWRASSTDTLIGDSEVIAW
jgi:hypothetical protein